MFSIKKKLYYTPAFHLILLPEGVVPYIRDERLLMDGHCGMTFEEFKKRIFALSVPVRPYRFVNDMFEVGDRVVLEACSCGPDLKSLRIWGFMRWFKEDIKVCFEFIRLLQDDFFPVTLYFPQENQPVIDDAGFIRNVRELYGRMEYKGVKFASLAHKSLVPKKALFWWEQRLFYPKGLKAKDGD